VSESREVGETIGYQLRRLRRLRGLTQEELADRANVSRDLVAKLEQGRRHTARISSLASFARALDVELSALVEHESDDGEAAGFFGGTVVSIATPLRQTTAGRPLVAQEDVEAAMVLTRFLDGAGITTDLQHVSTAGELDVAPSALVAICGPKSSPVVRQLIAAADPALAFRSDGEDRWRIVERASGRIYGSPIDDDPNADRDVAYLARLPRLAGAAPMLVVAGVHAIGSLGAMTYLTATDNLRDLHRTVADHSFSMVIESQFTRTPLKILSAYPLTQPSIHTTEPSGWPRIRRRAM
jgi:transcriptional regulator with XRE-family HTH domain